MSIINPQIGHYRFCTKASPFRDLKVIKNLFYLKYETLEEKSNDQGMDQDNHKFSNRQLNVVEDNA